MQFYVFLASLVYIWFARKDWRRKVVVPTVILLIVLFNPLCYMYLWPRVVDYAFSRLLWFVPIVPVIAAACVSLVGSFKRPAFKVIAVAVICLALTQSGQYMYKTADNGAGSYYRTVNAYHLPQEAVDVADRLLEKDARPRVVADMDLSVYLRQYSANIQQYTGRYKFNLRYRRHKEMQDQLIGQAWDLEWIRDRMKEEGYRYLVMREDRASRDYTEKCGFTFTDRVETPRTAYMIYRLD